MQIPNIFDVLSLLVSGVASGYILSFLAEKTNLFQKLSSQAKSWLIFAVSILLPVLGQVLIQFVPVTFWEVVQPYWQALATGFVVWLGSQYAYVRTVRPYTEERRWQAAERITALLDEDKHCCCKEQ